MSIYNLFQGHVPQSEAVINGADLSITQVHYSHLLNVGAIEQISNLAHFSSAVPFAIIFDVFHIPWLPRPAYLNFHKWKVLAIAALNLDGSNFHFLYMTVVCVNRDICGRKVIDAGLEHVMHSIRRAGLTTSLMAIISDGCPVNLRGRIRATHDFPILWDIVHLRANLAKNHGITDTVLDQIYCLKFDAEHWQAIAYPPVLQDLKDGRIQTEVDSIRRLVERRFAFSAEPFTTLERLNSTNLELCVRVIVNLVFEVLERHGAAVMQPAPVRFMARIVGVAELLTLKPNSIYQSQGP